MFDSAVSSAQDSRIPEIAELAKLPLRSVIAAKSVTGSVASLGTPLIAGVVAGLTGTVATLWYSALALILGGFLSSLIMGCCCSQPSLPPSSAREFSIGNVAPLWRERHLRGQILLTAGIIAIMSATSAVVAPRLLTASGGDVQDYGIFVAALSLGSILGSTLYGVMGELLTPRMASSFGFAIMSVVMIVLRNFFSVNAMFVGGFLVGVAITPMVAATSVLLYQRVEFQRRGRSLGVVSAMMTGAAPPTIAMIGYLFDKYGSQTTLGIIAAAAGSIALAIWRPFGRNARRKVGC